MSVRRTGKGKTKTKRNYDYDDLLEEDNYEIYKNMKSVHKQIASRRQTPYVKTMFRKDAPLLIITAGPTGSGKSRMPQLVYNMLYKTNSRSTQFDQFYIDDYVVNAPEYKRAINEIITEYGITNRTTYDELPTTSLDKFATSYFAVRNTWKDQYQTDVDNARSLGKNVVVETTGKKIPKEYVRDFAGYNIVFVYSFAQFDVMRERNIARFKEHMNAYLRNPDQNPAPRIPDMTVSVYEAKVREIETQLGKLRDVCLNNGGLNNGIGGVDECGDIDNSQRFNLLVVDNTGVKPNIVYDHRKFDRLQDKSSFNKLIQTTVGLSGGFAEANGGSRKRRRKSNSRHKRLSKRVHSL